MDVCLKMRILRDTSRRVVLQGDDVKDDNGYNASFTEQGASASHMAATIFSGYHLQTSWYGRRSQRRGIRIRASTYVGGRSQIADVP